MQWKHPILLMTLCVAGIAAAQQPRHGRKYVPPPPTTHLQIHVTKETNGKPVPNAAVIFRPLKNGKEVGDLEIKTDQGGVAVMDLLPQDSSVDLQVVAGGYKTYAQIHQVKGDDQTIEVVLQKPGSQYSAYTSGPLVESPKAGDANVKLAPLPPKTSAPPATAETPDKP